jgi:hypothetical protein
MVNARKRVLFVGIGAFVLVLLYVFVRGWVEVGEERFWILLFLFTVPVAMAVLAVWTMNQHSWVVRALLGVLTLIIVPVLLVQAALLADRIYENPVGFRLVLPAILKAEALFLAVFPVEPHRHARYQEKEKRFSSSATTKGSSP